MGEIVLKSKLFTSSCLNYRQNVHDRVHDQQIRSSLQFPLLKSESWLSLNSQFYGRRIGFIADDRKMGICRRGKNQSANAQMMSIGIGKAQKWWERGLKDNIIEITSTQHLVDSLSNAGDQLVVLAFFSPGCGGCKALHPKLCQLAEQNPEVKFLHVNYEEHKSMCCSLNVHVLPFFRFYRGAHGRVCSFSCTNATIKKFRDALAKYGPEQCSIGPTKGLEEKELIALSANRDLDFTYTPKPVEDEILVEEQEEIPTPANTIATTSSTPSNSSMPLPLPLPLSLHDNSTTSKENLVAAGR